jgi:signal transduction histidine kinase
MTEQELLAAEDRVREAKSLQERIKNLNLVLKDSRSQNRFSLVTLRFSTTTDKELLIDLEEVVKTYRDKLQYELTNL